MSELDLCEHAGDPLIHLYFAQFRFLAKTIGNLIKSCAMNPRRQITALVKGRYYGWQPESDQRVQGDCSRSLKFAQWIEGRLRTV